MADGTNKAKTRPLSPHLQIWRWHVTMATSILHRATGIANGVGLVIILVWLASLSGGKAAYESFTAFMANPFCQLVLLGIVISNTYHIANGIRHLIWNLGIGLDKKTASFTAWLVIILGAISGIAIYGLGLIAAGR